MASHLKGVKKGTMTDEMRKALCEHSKDNPSCTQKELQEWVLNKYHLQISQGTISNTLKRSAEFLSVDLQKGDVKRRKLAKFPDLERALYEWIVQFPDRANLSRDLIQETAKEFMKKLYPNDTPQFNFSLGWLEKFKLRHGIKSFRCSGDSESVDMEKLENKLKSIREKIDQFPAKDVFNMDVTGLFFRLLPDHSLARKQFEGKKQDKEKLTVVICCNEDGSEKIPLWIIGKYAKPCCLKNVNMNSLNCHYRANKRAWMTGVLFEEYARWLDENMLGRKVLLVVDGCSAYPKTIEGLQNVDLCFLPPNRISKNQTGDVGIIRAFKMHYRRRFCRCLLEGYEVGKPNPEKINVVDAINLATSAWTVDVQAMRIANCFLHCKIRSLENITSTNIDEPFDGDDIHELGIIINELGYRDKMDANYFLNFPGENDTSTEILSIDHRTHNKAGKPEDEDADDDDDEPLVPVSLKEALKASMTLQNFLLQYENTTPELLGALRTIRDEIQLDLNFDKKQVTLDSFIWDL